MLTVKPQLNLKNAREYYREHLSAGDYHSQGRRVVGEWFGQGAERLGLKGTVRESDFLALCKGTNPKTGRNLTVRRNSSRRENGRSVANRRVFYDLALSPPKSVSIVALMRDERILDLHDRAVRTAAEELEKFAQARIRRCGQKGERETGNVVAALFRHDTSRAMDPHLHSHCVIFNATFDHAERRWKALQVCGLYRAQRFVENLYYHELTRGLRRLGYEIENHARDFELKGISPSLIARFSKRHLQIDLETERRLRREGLHGELKAVRRQVAETGRQRKMKDSTADRLGPYWQGQLSSAEAKALSSAKPKWRLPWNPRQPAADLRAILDWADERVFERKAVAPDHELWSAVLERGRGHDFELSAARAEIARRGYLCEPGSRRITTEAVLQSEMAVVLAARHGRNWLAPLNPNFRASPKLSAEQRTAVERILASPDFITLFRGGAGTGKSFALAEVKGGIEAAGHPVIVLAPQRQQVAGLQADGLPAETVSRCLQAEAVPPGAVVLVDEAGQIGARQLSRLVALAQRRHGRLVLSGDTRQHGAVEASDALAAIERYSGARPAVLRSIRRQDPARAASEAERRRISAYRAAVKAAADGRIAESFDRLDGLGWIIEATPDARLLQVAGEYVRRVGLGERTLAVAQTWADVNALNAAIRHELTATGRLGPGSPVKAYQAIDLTEAQKRDPRFHEPGRFAFFLQRYGRFAKGDLVPIASADSQGLVVVKDGRRSHLSYRYANRLAVAAERELEIAPGDRLQLEFNGRSADGWPIINGELVTVRRLHQNCSLVVESEAGLTKRLAPNQRLFHLGYCVTSYSSQGKTVDAVLVADSGCQAVADRKHWYVAISRGRKSVTVFTPDKERLRANIEHLGDRTLALDLVPGAEGAPFWGERARAIIERARLHTEMLRRSPGRSHAPRQTAGLRVRV